LTSETIRCLLEDAEGRLWVGTSGGLNLHDGASDRFTRFVKDPADPHSLGDNDVMSLFQDRGGVVWIGTRSGGVHRWNPATWSFGLHRGKSDDPMALSGEPVQAFAEDAEGGLWIGSLGGLDRLDRQQGTVRHLGGPKGALRANRVASLLTDRQGLLWVGTIDSGLMALDPRSESVRAFRNDPARDDSLGSNGVMSLLEDSRGRLWIGTHRGGLNRLDRATGRFTRFVSEERNPRSLSSDIVTCLAEDPSGSLWVGTEGGGVNLFDRDSETIRRVVPGSDPATSLGAETVFALHVDAAGTLWVGTRGGGLARLESLDRATGRAVFRRFTERDGLPNSVVYGILPDDEGYLWLSTNNGLSRFDPRKGSFRNFDVSHGLQGNEFNFGAHYRSPSGELFFGGPGGFNVFVPSKLERNTHAPAVVLTAFLKQNAPVRLDGPVHALERIDLAYNDDVVTFEFAALDFAAPERNRYSYKLEGFDADWIELGNVHRITFTDLDAGGYTLRVRATNNDGVASADDLTLAIGVESPPWRTWWAYGAYALVIASVVLSIVRAQREKREREAAYTRRLEAEVEARTHELAERNSQLEEANAKLLETSLTDSLTGLRNRRFLFEEVAKDFALAARSLMGRNAPGEVVKLLFMMIDLDGFKPINDTLGHAAGDRVLLQVRDLLQRACRGSDIVIRWGGDEFLIVGRSEHLAGVEVFPERIRRTVETAVFDVGQGQTARLSCSIGFTSYPMGGADPQQLTLENMVTLADRALYMAKRSGRNGWVGLLGTPQTGVGDVLRVIREGEARPGGSLEIRSSSAPQP
jgi:diguanylate cyclase (GGDEF)-like protein